MAKQIPISLNQKIEIEIDGARIAAALGLGTEEFRRLIDDHKIAQLCERGTDKDQGLYRATFYHQQKRVRIVISREGEIIGDIES